MTHFLFRECVRALTRARAPERARNNAHRLAGAAHSKEAPATDS